MAIATWRCRTAVARRSISTAACSSFSMPRLPDVHAAGRAALVALALAACSTADPMGIDAGAARPDARIVIDPGPPPPDAAPRPDAERVDAAGPWRHTIAIDGINDF